MLNSNELHAAARRLMVLGTCAPLALHEAVREGIEVRAEFLGATQDAETWVKEGWRLFTEGYGPLSPAVVQVLTSLDRNDIRIESFVFALQRFGLSDWERALRQAIRTNEVSAHSGSVTQPLNLIPFTT